MHSISSEESSLGHNKSMGEQQGKEEEKKKKKKIIKETREIPSKTKEVIISVYVESPPIHPHKKGSDIIPIKKSAKSKQIFPQNHRTAKTQGYDRRAQLLAYSQELRKSDSKQPQWLTNGSKPKQKVSVYVFFCFCGMHI